MSTPELIADPKRLLPGTSSAEIYYYDALGRPATKESADFAVIRYLDENGELVVEAFSTVERSESEKAV